MAIEKECTPRSCGAGMLQRARPILLVGNPNCGKTTLFNALTGNRHKVANYPGVTVEKKQGTVSGSDIQITDLPGIYSLSGQSEDERIAESELLRGQASGSVIVAVIDASNLERNLFLVSELMDLDSRLIIALNMVDVAKRDGIKIREVLLERELGVPVISLSAKNRESVKPVKELIQCCAQCNESTRCHPKRFGWAQLHPDFKELVQKPSAERTIEEAGKIAAARYEWIKSILEKCVVREKETKGSRSEKIDKLVLHPVIGMATFGLLMALVFQAVFWWASYPMDLIESLITFCGNTAAAFLPNGILKSLIVDGVIAGVGSVIIFIPQIAILFFLIGLLEQSGYLCRAAVLMDRYMRQFGLQGRSFIPLLSSFACAVPGIMATRSIPSYSDRLITILVAPLMSCSARLPVYTVLIAACIPNHSWYGLSVQGLVLLALYLLGIFGAAFVAWTLKLTLLRGQPGLFLMELPRYKIPELKSIALEIWDRVKIFLRDAGTVILACSIVLWFLASFPQGWDQHSRGGVKESYAGKIGQLVEPVIKPLGYNWEIGIALLTSFAAREVFISTLGTVYNLGDESDDVQSLSTHLKSKKNEDGSTGFKFATGMSLLVFYVFACQCMSTLAVCKRETGSWVWPAVMFGYMTTLAYGAAWITYRLCV
ncbi:MAG: ferrous iron transport protein B [Bdellovibrionales bacterium]|nr:ferrous iron transport protein B [Bdellovibrionales bacterium]